MPEWFARSDPQSVKEIPWLSPQAVAYLTDIIRPEFDVIEHGSGGSSLWFAERVNSVCAFEQNHEWAEVIRQKAVTDNLIVIDVELEAYLENYTGSDFDLMLIDGEPVETRKKWMLAAPQLVKPGGWVVLDNANRPEYTFTREWLGRQAELVKTCNGNKGGTLYLVTEFYRMPK